MRWLHQPHPLGRFSHLGRQRRPSIARQRYTPTSAPKAPRKTYAQSANQPEPEKGPLKAAPENRTLNQSCGKTKPVEEVLVIWEVPETISAPELIRVDVEPRTATNTTDIIGRCRRTHRIGLFSTSVRSVPIRTPLPNIARHICQTIWMITKNVRPTNNRSSRRPLSYF